MFDQIIELDTWHKACVLTSRAHYLQVKLTWKGSFDGKEVSGELDIQEIRRVFQDEKLYVTTMCTIVYMCMFDVYSIDFYCTRLNIAGIVYSFVYIFIYLFI